MFFTYFVEPGCQAENEGGRCLPLQVLSSFVAFVCNLIRPMKMFIATCESGGVLVVALLSILCSSASAQVSVPSLSAFEATKEDSGGPANGWNVAYEREENTARTRMSREACGGLAPVGIVIVPPDLIGQMKAAFEKDLTYDIVFTGFGSNSAFSPIKKAEQEFLDHGRLNAENFRIDSGADYFVLKRGGERVKAAVGVLVVNWESARLTPLALHLDLGEGTLVRDIVADETLGDNVALTFHEIVHWSIEQFTVVERERSEVFRAHDLGSRCDIGFPRPYHWKKAREISSEEGER